ncbi:MAG: hypothetical protein A2148_03130 [Chloroflexi bacterium RBG_16_68_14]|nr:MAG: hypothetical protein A2148_03130 [Chloroflexi bacterium RBG_16_68_14]
MMMRACAAGAIAAVAALLLLPEAVLASNGLPPELEYRGGDLLAQALGGVGGAFLTLAATYWVARRRVKD